MGAVMNMHAALHNARQMPAPSASSFGSWLQSLSSGLHMADNLDQVLDDILGNTPAADEKTPWPRFDMFSASAELRTAKRRIRELEAELAHMRELVCEDPLTGSLNRRGLSAALERELARVRRSRSPLCVALLDLDNFKKLNDTHGHCGGDAALVHLVHIMNTTLRKVDIIGRFGGEEFMIVLPDTPLEDAIQAISRVQSALRANVFMHDNMPVSVTFSAGVTLCRAGDDQAAPMSRADAALYQAKRAGKNRVVGTA